MSFIRKIYFIVAMFSASASAQITVPYYDIEIPICIEEHTQTDEAKLFLSFTQISSTEIISGHGILGLTSQNYIINQSLTTPSPIINSYSAFGQHLSQNKLYGLTEDDNHIRQLYSLDNDTNVLTELASVDLEPAPDNPDVTGAAVIGDELWVLIATTVNKDDNNGQIYIFDLNNPTSTPTLLQDGADIFMGSISPNYPEGGISGDIVIDPDTVSNQTDLVFFRLDADTIFKVVYNRTTSTVASETVHYTVPAARYTNGINGALGLIQYSSGDKLYLFDKSLVLIEIDKITGVGTDLFTANIPQLTTDTPLISSWADMSLSLPPVFESNCNSN